MSVSRCLQKSIHHSASDSVIRICMDSNPISNLICDLKANTADIICQPVRILLENAVYGFTVFLIYPGSQIQRNPIFLQKHHCFAHICLLSNLHRDLSRLFFTDSLNFSKTFRFFFHNMQGVFSKPPDNPGCQCCTNSFDGPGSQVTFHRHGILRHFFGKDRHLELLSINRVLDIASCKFYRSSHRKHRKSPYTGQFFLTVYSF